MEKFEFNPSINVFKDMAENEETHWWYRGLRDFVKFNIINLPLKKVLDAGCGTGMNLVLFKNMGYEVDGFDYSKEAVSYSKLRGFNNLKIGSILDIPYNSNSFDLITCFDVLGALTKPQMKDALNELNRVVKKNGYILIHAAALPWMKDLHNSDWDFKSKYYIHEFKEVFGQLDLEIIRATYRVSLLFPLIFVFRLAQKFLNSNKRNESKESIKTNPILNEILYIIMKLENFILRYVNLPIGNSVFLLVKKK